MSLPVSRIEHLDLFNNEDRNWRQFEVDRDPAKFGAQWASFSRASVFPTLALGLDGGRDDQTCGQVRRQIGSRNGCAFGSSSATDEHPTRQHCACKERSLTAIRLIIGTVP